MIDKELNEYLNKQANKIFQIAIAHLISYFFSFLFNGAPKQKTITVNGVSYPFDGKTDVNLRTRKGDIIGRIK